MVFPFDADELAVEEGRRRLNKGGDQSQDPFAGLAEVTSSTEKTLATLELPASPQDRGPGKRKEASDRRWLAPALVALIAAFALAGMFLYFRRGLNPPAAPPVVVAQTEVQEPLGLSSSGAATTSAYVEWQCKYHGEADFGMLLIRGASVSRDVPKRRGTARTKVVYSAPVDQRDFG
jgi:hypothetical protein